MFVQSTQRLLSESLQSQHFFVLQHLQRSNLLNDQCKPSHSDYGRIFSLYSPFDNSLPLRPLNSRFSSATFAPSTAVLLRGPILSLSSCGISARSPCTLRKTICPPPRRSLVPCNKLGFPFPRINPHFRFTLFSLPAPRARLALIMFAEVPPKPEAALTVDVTYQGVSRPVAVGDATLDSFFTRSLTVFSLPPILNSSPTFANPSSLAPLSPVNLDHSEVAPEAAPAQEASVVPPITTSRVSATPGMPLAHSPPATTPDALPTPAFATSAQPLEDPMSMSAQAINDHDASSSPLSLAFQTEDGADTAVITSDFALRLSLNTPPSTGRLILEPAAHLPSVDACIQTVLRAVVDTAARRDAAAVFLALSGAWSPASKETSETSDVYNNNHSVRNNLQHQQQSQSQQRSNSQQELQHPQIQASHPLPTQRNLDSEISNSKSPPKKSNRLHTLQQQHSQILSQFLQNSLTVRDTLSSAVTDAGVYEPQTARAVADGAIARSRESDDSCCGLTSNDYTPACFSTHTGVRCSHCHVEPIMGTRYRSCSHVSVDQNNTNPSSSSIVNLCERCRRLLRERDDSHSYTCSTEQDCCASARTFVVFDHPWEATEEYAQLLDPESPMHRNTPSMAAPNIDLLKAPSPPLRLGDIGPRVLHLHYVLYKTGLLNMGNKNYARGSMGDSWEWLKPGVFCAGTSEVVWKIQRDNWTRDTNGHIVAGVYDHFTKNILIALLEKAEACAEAQSSIARCSAPSGAENTRLAMALAA